MDLMLIMTGRLFIKKEIFFCDNEIDAKCEVDIPYIYLMDIFCTYRPAFCANTSEARCKTAYYLLGALVLTALFSRLLGPFF
jgi:hypothetical protein